jgi:adenylate cyclase
MELSDNLRSMDSSFESPYLVISGLDTTRNVPLLGANSWRMGRDSDSAIILRDELVSRNHAMIQRMDSGEYFLIDMGSRNGSFVNERRVSTPVALKDGDRLKVGHAEMLFRNPLATAPTVVQTKEDIDATVCHLKLCVVSILVIDIRGFTVLSQNIDNELLCELMGAWFGAADRIMRGHGSVAEKFIGDAVMAVWVHQAKGQEHMEILEILRAVGEFADTTQTLSARFGLSPGLRIGAGLNTGPATIGNTGTNQVTDYTAMGECVNAAFRLETATKSLDTDCCLGKTTSDLLRFWPHADAFLQEKNVELKGYKSLVRTCPATFASLKGFVDSLGNQDKTLTM